MSRDDLTAIYAYLRRVPAVDRVIDPDDKQVDASIGVEAHAIELHTGDYANPPLLVAHEHLRARDGDDSRMSLHEIGGIAFNLLFAGHETTSSAAVNMFSVILQRPGLWQRICSGEQPLQPVVEEALRFDPPIQAWSSSSPRPSIWSLWR